MRKYVGVVTITDYLNAEYTTFLYNKRLIGPGANVFTDRDGLRERLDDFIYDEMYEHITSSTGYETLLEAVAAGDLQEYGQSFYFSPTEVEMGYEIIELNEEDE